MNNVYSDNMTYLFNQLNENNFLTFSRNALVHFEKISRIRNFSNLLLYSYSRYTDLFNILINIEKVKNYKEIKDYEIEFTIDFEEVKKKFDKNKFYNSFILKFYKEMNFTIINKFLSRNFYFSNFYKQHLSTLENNITKFYEYEIKCGTESIIESISYDLKDLEFNTANNKAKFTNIYRSH